MFFESEICPLEPLTSSNLQIRVRIPKDSEHHYMMMLLKIKTNQKMYVGPNLVAFIKVIDMAKARQDERRLLDKSKSAELASSSLQISQFQQNEVLIRKGHDVYTDQELLHMASVLLDEGFGSLERCLNAIRILRGDIGRAKEVLSNLMITEAQLR